MMSAFRYSALTRGGDLVRGEIVAADAAAAIASLQEQALLPIDATEAATESAATASPILRQRGSLPTADLALVSQQCARLLKAGLPLDRTLSIIIELTERPRTRQALRRTLDRVRNGSSLADALERQGACFPKTFVALVRAGELSGGLQAVLTETASFLQRSNAMQQKAISAMVYPVILIVAASLSVGLILTAVLPQFEPMFREAGSKLPELTRIIIVVGDGLRSYGWLVASIFVAAALAWRLAMRDPSRVEGRDRMILALPTLGYLVRRFEVGRFCRTLGVMLSSGVSAPIAMGLASGTIGNRILAAAVDDAAGKFREGEGLSGPLASTGCFPALATQLIRIGEETGRLDDMLGEIAELFDQEVQRTLERLLAALVPSITVVMGLLIALIVAAVMTALMTVNALAV